MYAVLAVGEKTIERYISRLAGISVLTTVKRREQVIDAVINRNPACVVLSTSLQGKTEFREIVKTLRRLKPKLKIVFFIGDLPYEKKGFTDFLVRHGVYDFVDGNITEDEVNRVLFQNAALEDVKQYLLDDTEYRQAAQERDRLLLEQSKSEPPASMKNRELRVLIIDKVVEKRTVQNFYLGNVIIGVGSLFSRAGCTKTALEIGQYLARKKYSVGVVVGESVYRSLAEYYQLKSNLFGGVHIYSDGVAAAAHHKILICDFGNIANAGDEFYKSAVSVLVCPSAPWEIDRLTEFIRDNPISDKLCYAFYPVSDDDFKSLRRNLARGGCRAYRLNYNPNYSNCISANASVYGDILSPLLKTIRPIVTV